MSRLLGTAALLLSTTALATGERILLEPSENPLRDALCLSMSCEKAGRPDAVVSTRSVRGGLEVTVTAASGQRRLTHLVKAKSDGSLSSTDLVRATSLVVRAIEEGPVEGDRAPPPAKKLAGHKKKGKTRLLAHR